ncbi:AAA family ATPase [Vibrio alginolyticus]
MLENLNVIAEIKQLNHRSQMDNNFTQLSLIYGLNGDGKSTLSKIFQLISEKDIPSINNMKSLESDESKNPNFVLRFSDSKTITPNNINALEHNFLVFNQNFIDSNVHSSSKIESSNLQNYYNLCLGSFSVEKQKKIDDLKLQNSTFTTEKTEFETKLTQRFQGLTVSEITKLKPIKDADRRIAELESKLDDVKAIDVIKKLTKPSKLSVSFPELDFGYLNVSVEKISRDATEEIKKHLSNNHQKENKKWVKDGVDLVTENQTCPFCAQSLNESPIYTHYKHFLDETYQVAVNAFTTSNTTTTAGLDNIYNALLSVKKDVDSANQCIESWKDRVSLNSLTLELAYLSDLDAYIKNFKEETERMESDIFIETDLSKTCESIIKILSDAESDISTFNKSIQSCLDDIQSYISTLESTTEADINTNITNLKNAIESSKADVKQWIKDRKDRGAKVTLNNKTVKALREEIESDQKGKISTLSKDINEILQKFGSHIRLIDLEKDYKAKKGNDRFKFGVKFIENELSTSNAAESEKVIGDLLSTGDKNALALAFFFAKVRSGVSENSIIVFDDPMSSLDRHRRHQTKALITKIARNNQVLVMSHDPFFLKELYDYQNNNAIASYFRFESSTQVTGTSHYRKSSLISTTNLSKETTDPYEQCYKSLLDYCNEPSDDPTIKLDAIRRIRTILEAKIYMSDPNTFSPNEYLGTLIGKVRNRKDNQDDIFYIDDETFEDIEDLNEYTGEYHHADGVKTVSTPIDMTELRTNVQKTLECVTRM